MRSRFAASYVTVYAPGDSGGRPPSREVTLAGKGFAFGQIAICGTSLYTMANEINVYDAGGTGTVYAIQSLKSE